MLSIRECMEVLEQRKATVMQPPDGPSVDGVYLQYSASPEQDKAILSGYDIDHDELLSVLEDWTEFFIALAVADNYGLRVLFRAALADAFQVGLIKGANSRE